MYVKFHPIRCYSFPFPLFMMSTSSHKSSVMSNNTPVIAKVIRGTGGGDLIQFKIPLSLYQKLLYHPTVQVAITLLSRVKRNSFSSQMTRRKFFFTVQYPRANEVLDMRNYSASQPQIRSSIWQDYSTTHYGSLFDNYQPEHFELISSSRN